MILQSTSEIECLFQCKHHRLKLTDSLHDFFALNPKYYNNTTQQQDDKAKRESAQVKSVHFAQDSSDNASNTYQDFSVSARSLTSIAEETIDLDQTQHARRSHSDALLMDTTEHHRKDE